MTTSRNTTRFVRFQTERAVTTLAEMAREQTERLGRRIRERREELGLGQRDVADRMTDFPKVSDQYVSKWERGKNRPDDEHLDALAVALETTTADLVAGPLSERAPRPEETPDLIGAMNGDRGAVPNVEALQAQLDRIERGQTELRTMLIVLLGHFQLEEDRRVLDAAEQASPTRADETETRTAA